MDFISIDTNVAGYVKHYEDTIEDGKHTITFNGVELKGIAAKRLIIPDEGTAYQSYTNQSPEYVIGMLLNRQLTSPTDINRRIYGTIPAYTATHSGISYSGRYQNLADEIETLATTYNIGWCASIENGAIVWKIWNGADRTAAQSTNNRMILDYEYGTMNNSKIAIEEIVPTYMIIAGQGEGAERVVAEINRNETALARIETFIDARDVSDTALLTQRGEEKLAEFGDETNYTASLSNQAIQKYRIDYELGDIGTIRDSKIGNNLDYRITAIEEVYEDNQLSINLTFGYDKKQLKDAIKRMNSKRDALLAIEGGAGITVIDLSSTSVEGTNSIEHGGTGATNATDARTALEITPANIGAATANHTHTPASIGAAAETHTHSQYFETSKVIYAASTPTGVTGAIWLKPV